MPSEGVQKINEMIRQPKRRYRLISEAGKGKVVRVEPADDAGRDTERPGAERPILRPWAAVPKQS
jgi:hypothetical protein